MTVVERLVANLKIAKEVLDRKVAEAEGYARLELEGQVLRVEKLIKRYEGERN